MNANRYTQVYSAALAAQRSLKRWGRIRRNQLPLVSVFEHKWLCDHHPRVARLTRSFTYEDTEYIGDTGNYECACARTKRPGHRDMFASTRNIQQARPPVIREVWVGARSLGCIGEHELPEGHQHSQVEQEDQAELTDLMTMVYDDPVAFTLWLDREITRRLKALRKPVRNVVFRKAMRRLVLEEVPKDRGGEPCMAMICDEETGEYRPVRIGDVLVRAHGSNEDLDALFLEEPADERSDEDARRRELLRDRINPNSDFEQDMLNNPDMSLPSQADEYHEDELYLRRVANYLAEQAIERKPGLTHRFAEIREAAYRKVQASHGTLRTDPETGKTVAGHWLRPKDLWDDAEQRIRTLERHLQRKTKRPPAPVDWNAIRTTQEMLTRSEKLTQQSGLLP